MYPCLGLYEKTAENVVLRSFDVGTYTFEASTPYNITTKDVNMAEMNYYTELTKDTKLVVGANIVRTPGYLPLTSTLNIDEMFQVGKKDVLLYIMIRNWCTTTACTESGNTLEIQLELAPKGGIREFREISSPDSGRGAREMFCNDSKSSCQSKFEEYQLNSWHLAFSNYVSYNGGYKYNRNRVHTTTPYNKSALVTLEVEINASEILFGPLRVAWNQYPVSSVASCNSSGCMVTILLSYLAFWL